MSAQESSLPPEKQAATPASEAGGTPIPRGSDKIKLMARLEPEVHRHLKLVADTEDISLNDAINLIISRYHHYPKDLAEVHRQIKYCKGQLEIIQTQMELGELHENRLIQLIESGQVEERLQEIQDKEEAALAARYHLHQPSGQQDPPDAVGQND